MVATRCLCCGSGVQPGGAKTFGVLMFLLSWYANNREAESVRCIIEMRIQIFPSHRDSSFLLDELKLNNEFLGCRFCFIVAASALLAGAAQNKIRTEGYHNYFAAKVTCAEVRKSVFAAGAAFVFLTTVFSELYYVLISKAMERPAWQTNGPSVGMSPYP